MVRWWRGFAAGILIGLLVGGVFLGGYFLGTRQQTPNEAAAGFDLLWSVRDLLDRSFIGDAPATDKQVHAAAKGLVASYGDPYTVFVDPAPREVERDELRGHFGGIGAYMGRNEANELVLTVMRDRPAARAGIQDGDVLLAVDGTAITPEMTVDEIVSLVRGEVGVDVVLRVRRGADGQPFDVTVKREQINTPSVEWRVLDKAQQIGYARISIFGERTSEELRTGLAELAAQGVNKVVLDLRGNGGGLVDAAVDITSQFLKSGNVLREVKRGDQERFYPVKSVKSPAQDWEMVILTDGGTASASEIVAGALRDQGRAKLIGDKTFGKGSVQEVHEFPDGSSLHVTVARWLTPDRHTIDKTGLEPDVKVELTDDDRSAGRDPQLDRAQRYLAGER
jgi:carboxyl-terminal processing protease